LLLFLLLLAALCYFLLLFLLLFPAGRRMNRHATAHQAMRIT
jgi:hypothetical protein